MLGMLGLAQTVLAVQCKAQTVSDSATTAMSGIYTLTVTLSNSAINIANTTVHVNDTLPTAVENHMV